MRKTAAVFCCVLMSLMMLITGAFALIPSVNLSIFSLKELEQFRTDLETEDRIHYTVTEAVSKAIFGTVRAATETYYNEKGIKVSWAWYGWEYSYTREVDYFEFSSHLNYETGGGQSRQVKVSARLYRDAEGFHIYRLYLDGDPIISNEYVFPENKLIDTGNVVINEKTGINLSLLTKTELQELKKRTEKEISTNHQPVNSGKVNEVLKKTVEAYFAKRGVLTVEWPWFEYEYTCDWDCYTESTRISYEEEGLKHKNEAVYAEIFPDGDGYRVYYLTINGIEILDERAKASGENATVFLNRRKYEKAEELQADGLYEEALSRFEEISGFDDSGRRAEECREALRQIRYEEAEELLKGEKYEEALAAFEALGDFSDSRERAEECRAQLTEITYQEALARMEQGDYTRALAFFTGIGAYKDSEAKAAECREQVNRALYEDAMGKMAEQAWAEAAEILSGLEGWEDSGEKLAQCREEMNSRAYAAAGQLAADGAYEEARAAFEALGDYQDSREQAGRMGEILASLDREILLSAAEYTLYPGEKVTAEAEIRKLREDAGDGTEILYESLNPETARAAKDGTVSALKAGEAVIRCALADNPYITKDLLIHVVSHVSRVTLDTGKLSLTLPEQNGNSTAKLTAAAEPADAHIQTGVWSSQDEGVATVDQEGRVTAVSMGRTVITYTSDDGNGTKSAKCTVTVGQAVSSLTLPETYGTVVIGKPVTLRPEIAPANALNKTLIWTSGDESIATVSAGGQIKGVNPGAVTITAASPDGPSVSYLASVKLAPVTLRVSGKAKCTSGNSKGNTWVKTFSLNGKAFTGTGRVKAEDGDEITLGCSVGVKNREEGIGTWSETITVTPEIMRQGLKKKIQLTTEAPDGENGTKTVEWTVTITIKP